MPRCDGVMSFHDELLIALELSVDDIPFDTIPFSAIDEFRGANA
jgi:hypothetical protein